MRLKGNYLFLLKKSVYIGEYFFTEKDVELYGCRYILHSVHMSLYRTYQKSSQNCQESSKLSIIIKILPKTAINMQTIIKQLRKIVVKLWKSQKSVNMGLGLRESMCGWVFFSLLSFIWMRASRIKNCSRNDGF